MSTRATYQFGPGKWTPRVVLYIHHDGYTEGAASYLYRALIHPNQRGGLACAMIRANDGAEITTHHDDHGDTEFQYDIRGEGPGAEIVWREVNYDREPNKPRQFGGGGVERLADFINRQGDKLFVDDFHPFKAIPGRYDGETPAWYNLDTARQRLEGKYGPLEHLRIWSKNNVTCPDSGNWQSCAAEVKQITDAFPELATLETRYIMSTVKVIGQPLTV